MKYRHQLAKWVLKIVLTYPNSLAGPRDRVLEYRESKTFMATLLLQQAFYCLVNKSPPPIPRWLSTMGCTFFSRTLPNSYWVL
jgi:hypothetical protein